MRLGVFKKPNLPLESNIEDVLMDSASLVLRIDSFELLYRFTADARGSVNAGVSEYDTTGEERTES